MDWTGAKLCALAQSRCSMSLRLKAFSQPGSGAVITTSHSSVMGVGDAFALDQPGHGLLRFLAGLAHRAPPAHDPAVKTEPKAGVRRIRVHDTRRTCGSLLAAFDVHPRVAMRILRHSKIAITMELYTMVPDEATLAALKRLGDALGSADAALPDDAE